MPVYTILKGMFKAVIARINLTVRKKINGQKVKVPLLHLNGWSNLRLSTKKDSLSWLLKYFLFKHTGAFIDVGINVGQTLLKVKTLKSDVYYLGFEPNPACCSYCNILVSKNNFADTIIIPVGLSSEQGLKQLNLSSEISSSASMIQGFRAESYYTQKYYVPVLTGDYCCKTINIDSVSVIKIDVEGGELEVVRGLISTIRKHRPYIICEILPTYNHEFRINRQEELCRIIRSIDYRIYRYYRQRLTRIEKIGIHSDLALCEYCFVPNEKKDALELDLHGFISSI